MSGVHRVKRDVDRFWLKQQLARKQMTLEAFGRALAKATKRPTPLDKASLSRRLKGAIPFTTLEAQAMHKLFDVPVDEVLARIGASHDAIPVIGKVDGTGAATATVRSHEALVQLRLETADGWNGSCFTFRTVATPPATATRGLYLVSLAREGDVLRQWLGVVGNTALIAPVFGAGDIQQVPVGQVRGLRRAIRIDLA
jgi:hypothetical protein